MGTLRQCVHNFRSGLFFMSEFTRKRFAHNVKLMVDATGADGKLNALDLRQSTDSRPGVDIDWEYPGLVSTPYNPLLLLTTCAPLSLIQWKR